MSLIAPDILESQGLPVTLHSHRHFQRMVAYHIDPLLAKMNLPALGTGELIEIHGLDSRSPFQEFVVTKAGLEPYTPE